jgi:hypothetical protein
VLKVGEFAFFQLAVDKIPRLFYIHVCIIEVTWAPIHFLKGTWCHFGAFRGIIF